MTLISKRAANKHFMRGHRCQSKSIDFYLPNYFGRAFHNDFSPSFYLLSGSELFNIHVGRYNSSRV